MNNGSGYLKLQKIKQATLFLRHGVTMHRSWIQLPYNHEFFTQQTRLTNPIHRKGHISWFEIPRGTATVASQFLHTWGVLASEGWREAWCPPPRRYPVAFSGQRQGWKTPKRTLWQCTASVCSRSALLGDLFGVSRSMERDLSVLLIYPRIFLCVFIVCCLLLGTLILLYVHVC